jgi:hypothetical protein
VVFWQVPRVSRELVTECRNGRRMIWLALPLEVQNGSLQKDRSISCLKCPYWNTKRLSKRVIVFPMPMSGSRPSLPSIPLQNRRLGPGKRTGPFLFLIFHLGRHSRSTVIFSNIYVRTEKHSTLSMSATKFRYAGMQDVGFLQG